MPPASLVQPHQQPPTPTPSTGAGEVTDQFAYRVKTKPNWGSDWEIRPDLTPIRSQWSLSPTVSSAQFRHIYGTRGFEGDPTFATVEALGIANHYVMIETFSDPASTPPAVPVPLWVGQFVHESRGVDGAQANTAGATASGTQQLMAFGLEHLLKKMPINESRVVIGSDVYRVDRPVTFNRSDGRGGEVIGNSAIDPTDSNFTVFDYSNDTLWTINDIVGYLLYNFVNERTTPVFRHVPQPVSENIKSVHDLFGMTVFDALNHLFDRRRGFCWYVRTVGEGEIEIVTTSVLDAAINVPGTVQLPANPSQTQILLDPDILVTKDPAPRITQSAANQYSEVQVRGAPIRVMGTWSYADGTLVEGWTSGSGSQAEDYEQGALQTAGYSGLTDAEKAKRNDQWRKENDKVNHVYLRHIVPKSWDWKLGNGFGEGDFVAAPTPRPFVGNVSILGVPADAIVSDKRFLPKLLTRRGIDYSQAGGTVDNNPSTIEPEFADPFCAVFHVVDGATDFITLRMVHQMGEAESNNLPRAGLRLHERGLGFDLVLDPKTPNHAFNWENWRALDASGDAEFSLFIPTRHNAVNYADLKFTAALETDKRTVYRVNTALISDNNTTLVIELPWVRYDYAVPGTIIGIDDGTGQPLRVHASNAVVRDDTEQLRIVGALIKAWYGRTRRSVDFAWRKIEFPEIGSLLQTVSVNGTQTQANSIVSAVEIDYIDATTRITTDFTELDFAGIFGGARGSVDGGTGPSLGPIGTATRTLAGKVAIMEQQYARATAQDVTGSVGISDAFIGKITGYDRDLCNVVRMRTGDPNDWGNASFFTDEVQCKVWKGVGSAAVGGDPVFCFKPSNSTRYVAMPWFNDVGDWDDAGTAEFQFGEPDDVVAPTSGLNEPEPGFDPTVNQGCPGAV